jgi:hypothetical protein
MKKFLSLVLAVIMTMSLVTISASAAEYKDFTDRDEIQYEEAVAVLNRLGIITGYSEGDFRPEGELTRGAAAKIIVSLLIGPEAANNVSPTTAPYKDVPLDHAFAGVIAYCKTAGIISGYSDGSFQPGGTLTGYAFSKMLLGALGFKSDIEHFTGSGWNMNVNARAAEAGLFDRLNFKGNDPVNREQAAQLALNTLKATMVEYSGGFTVNAGDASVVGGQARNYKTSNNQDYARNISGKQVEDGWWTVEFGEEHFIDLRLEHDKFNPTPNAMGDPSAEWSYKKVTIGTYPLEPDFSYDEQVSHKEDTVAAKKRALGLSGYEVDGNTSVWLNGFESGKKLAGVEDIADYTDNGTRVRVYVSETDADYITDVVVEKTQLMEVKRIGSDYVSLQMYDNGKSDDKGTTVFNGFNQSAINKNTENVQAEDDYYTFLSGLKSGDIVAVVPVSVDHGDTKYEVSRAYTPETATGTLTSVKTYGKTNDAAKAISVTVGGTAYDVALWNKDLADVDADKIKVTRTDVTLYMDEMGNAMLAKDIGATNDWMVIGNFRQTLDNGRLVTVVNGWDISGAELSLNLGPNFKKETYGLQPGDLVKYSSKTDSNITDWVLNLDGVYNVYAGKDGATNNPYEIKASNVYVKLNGYDNTNQAPDASQNDTEYMDKSVKFVYVKFDTDGEVESVEVKTGAQNVKNAELLATGGSANTVTYKADGSNATQVNNYDIAQAAVKVDSDAEKTAVKAVVIKSESSSASASNMLYIRDYLSDATKTDSNGKIVYGYLADMLTANGLEENVQIYSEKRLDRGDFASYSLKEHADFSPFYDLRLQNNQLNRTAATMRADLVKVVNAARSLIEVGNYREIQSTKALVPEVSKNQGSTLGIGNEMNVLNLRGAEWLDRTDNGHTEINSVDDLEDFKDVKLSLIFNDNPSNDGFRSVYLIVIESATWNEGGNGNSSNSGSVGDLSWKTTLNSRGDADVTLTIDVPSWIPNGAKLTAGTVKAFVNNVDLSSNLSNSSLNNLEVVNGKVTLSVRLRSANADDAEDIRFELNNDVAYNKVNVNFDLSKVELKDGYSTSANVGSSWTITFTLPAGKYEAGKVTVKQGATTLVSAQALTETELKNEGLVTLSLSTVTDDDPIMVTFTEMKETNRANIQAPVQTAPKNGDSAVSASQKNEVLAAAGGDKTNNQDAIAAAANSVIKSLEPGMYSLPKFIDGDGNELLEESSGSPLWCAGRYEDVLLFRFDKSGVVETYTIVIGDSTVYVESFTTTDANKSGETYFAVQVTSGNGGDFGNHSGNGDMTTTPLTEGQTYKYSVTGSVSGVLLEGEFTVTSTND